jgi:hypothetical protein
MTNESHPTLFGEEPEREGTGGPPVKARAHGVARVLQPNRAQLELRPCDLESLLAEGHRARIVWAYVERSDLSPLYAGIGAGGEQDEGDGREQGHQRCGFGRHDKSSCSVL